MGRIRVADHPLWSSFVWRNELADTFVEVVAAPWFARAAHGHRRCSTSGCGRWAPRIGRGVWCETYWLPEADLVDLRDGATVNQGCVVQTHLFHDRVLQHGHGHPASGRHARPEQRDPAGGDARAGTLRSGPVSLVMRGESVPDKTRWIGNPIGPWADDAATEA